MKTKFVLAFTMILCLGSAFAQPLTGIKTVGGFTPDYSTIASAITALNTNGVGSGGVTFQIVAGHYEVGNGMQINTTTSSITNPVVFEKSGFGADPVIRAGAGTSTTLDFIIAIVGSDYVTIDGIELRDTTTNTTTTTRIEFGIAILKQNAANACSNVTIRNCNIALQKVYTATRGVYIHNHLPTSTTALTITNTNGVHRNINIINNQISNVYMGVFQNGSTSTTYYDDSLTIQGNTITNFAGTSTAAYGIYHIYYRNLLIQGNTIIGGVGQTTTFYGIFTTTATGANIRVLNNFIRLQYNNTTSAVAGIYNTGGTSSGSLVIDSNIVDSSVSTTMTSGVFYGIWNSGSVPNIRMSHNQVSQNRRPTTTGATYYIYNSSGTNVNVFGNKVWGNLTTGGTSGLVYCMWVNGTTTNTYQNEVYNNARNTGTSSILSGIYVTSGTNARFYRNKIYNLSSTSSTPTVNGFQIAGGTYVFVYNNLIGNLTAPLSSISNSVNGINISTTSTTMVTSIQHNTVYLNASSININFGSNGVFVNTGPLVEMSNNIIYNNSQSSGTGHTVAHRRSSNAIGSYAALSNNNFYFAGTPSATNLIFFDLVNSTRTINDYHSLFSSSGREMSSVSDDSLSFLSTDGANIDFLKLNLLSASQTESGGRLINGMVDAYDLLGVRAVYPQTGQSNGGGKKPDIGAFEQDLIVKDLTGPEVIFNRLRNASVFATRSLNGVVIRDDNGVDTSLAQRPRLYFKKTSNANIIPSTNDNLSDGWKFVIANNNSSPFNFTINHTLLTGGNVSLGDTVEYFIVAKDTATNSNVRFAFATPALPSTSVVLNVQHFPVVNVVNKYVVDTALPFFITVGNFGTNDFTSLTRADGLFNAINNAVVTGDIQVSITSDILNENGLVALEELQQDGLNAGSHIITIIPSGTRYIAGSVTTGGLIKLRNTSNVVFDGNQFGARGFTFANTATSGAASVFQIIGLAETQGNTHIEIRSSNILTGNRLNASGYGIFIGGTAITTSNASGGFLNRFIRIVNNNIYRVYNGIGVLSHPSSLADSILIAQNEIGSDTVTNHIGAYAIRLNGLNNSGLIRNRVFNIVATSTASSTLWVVHLSSNVRNTTLDGNVIDNIRYTSTNYNTIRGISIAGTPNANVTLKNNIINRLVGSGADNSVYYGPVGIYFEGTGSNYKLYNNTVQLAGVRPVNTWTYIWSSSSYTYDLKNPYTSAVAITSSNISGLDIRNNIFSNVQASQRTSLVGFNFAFYSSSPNANFTHFSHNLFHTASNSSGMFNGFFYPFTTTNNFSVFRNAFPIMRNNYFGVTPFTSDSNLTVNLADTNVWNISGLGMPLTDVASDAAGNPRSVNVRTGATDIGAIEFGNPSVSPPAALEVGVPTANTTTSYLFRGDTIARIFWQPFSSVPNSVALHYHSGVNPTAAPNPGSYMNCRWTFVPSPANTYNFDLNLHYSPAHLGTVPFDSLLIAANYDNTNWTPFPIISSVNVSRRILTVTGMSFLYEYTGTNQNIPLPIKLLTFDAVKKGTHVDLDWSTASEQNASHFNIEKSKDGIEFDEIGKQPASNAQSIKKYRFVDKHAFELPATKVLYYRLKMADKDGSFMHSNVREVRSHDLKANIIAVHPNPFTSEFDMQISVNEETEITIEIKDINGRLLYTESFTTAAIMHKHYDQLANYAKGVYLVTVKAGSESQTIKLIKAE